MAQNGDSVLGDKVNYKIFVSPTKLETGKPEANLVDSRVDLYIASLTKYLTNYIWQDEHFTLSVADTQGKEPLPLHLHGSTKVGDYIEDEWFIVFLLFELSKEYLDIVIQVNDVDGEFLLIEAADLLPTWLNPESSINRVYIHQGEVHIVPKSNSSGNIDISLKSPVLITEAVDVVRKHAQKTKASTKIQEAVKRRVARYPGKLSEIKHRAHCYLPAAAVALLQDDPQLISAVVRTFCQRDSSHKNPCKVMRHFPPETRVISDVTFSRNLYAQLRQQRYEPDHIVGWNIPTPNSPRYVPYDLGMKIACGFEILLSKGTKLRAPEGNTGFDLSEVSVARWNRYLEKLKETGYFSREVEGSVQFQKLLSESRKIYEAAVLGRQGNIAGKVAAQFAHLDYDMDELKQQEKKLKPPDSEDWLEISPDDVDQILAQYQFGAGGISTRTSSHLRKSSGDSDIKSSSMTNQNKKISSKSNMDVDSFAESVGKILDFSIPFDSDSDSSSGMSGYGEEEEDIFHKEMNRLQDDNSLNDNLQDYIDIMDRELGRANMERNVNACAQNLNEINENKKANVVRPRQRPSQPPPEPPVLASVPSSTSEDCSMLEDFGEYQAVDVDLKTLLETYGTESNVSVDIASRGLALPEDLDEIDDEQ